MNSDYNLYEISPQRLSLEELFIQIVGEEIVEQTMGTIGIIMQLTIRETQWRRILWVAAFMFYSLAFVGGWVEQIGAVLRNNMAVDVGIVSGPLMPADALWKKASLLFQPEMRFDLDMAGPFIAMSEPSDLMTAYTVGYILVLLILALWSFSRRDL